MFPDTFRPRSFISALCALVDLPTNRCYKIRMSFNNVII
nr:unnamed protein product [Callosobruchus analis]